jgi:hypothetical protein
MSSRFDVIKINNTPCVYHDSFYHPSTRPLVLHIVSMSSCRYALYQVLIRNLRKYRNCVSASFIIYDDRTVSRGSSVSIVSDYGLDYRAIKVRSPAEAKDFSSSLCVQTSTGAHPASCTIGTGGHFPGDKARLRRDADRSPPSSAEVVNE